MDNVNRDSNQRKLKEFIKQKGKFIDEMEFKIRVNRSRFFLAIFSENRLREFAFIISLIMNISIFGLFKLEVVNNEALINQDFKRETLWFNALGIAHSTVTFLLLFTWFYNSSPLVVMNG